MFKILLPILLLLCSAVVQAETRNPDGYFFEQTFGDFKAELENARKNGQSGALVMFEMEGCPYCRKMRETVLSQAEVQDWYRKHFVIFSVDVKGDTPLVDFNGANVTEKAFAARFNVKYTPLFQFFDLDGKPTASFTGVTKGGVKEFLALGRWVVEGAYAKDSFADYKKAYQ
ncbi:MAG: thioredoxin family protein [Sulfuricella sp.]|nr:thioredoxin family protein [Sulfuricella sp.]